MLALVFLAFAVSASASTWNCPAPRSPDNGLSFIFRNGELVHFKCHPGYRMLGKAVAYCVNNAWTESLPHCIPMHQNVLSGSYSSVSLNNQIPAERPLFNWGKNVYGDGPRRLPLINGIWPVHPNAERVLSLGPQSTPGPKTMVKEEIDIAELRNMQLEELRKQRFKPLEASEMRKPAQITGNRETVLSLAATNDGQALSVSHPKPKLYPKLRHQQKWIHSKNNMVQPEFIMSRKSRVDNGYNSLYKNTPQELRRRPVEKVLHTQNEIAYFDASCVEYLYNRHVPKIAPRVSNAFVFRYETKRNNKYPFNKYMEVKYRCMSGFTFENSVKTLHCRSGDWIGVKPRCI